MEITRLCARAAGHIEHSTDGKSLRLITIGNTVIVERTWPTGFSQVPYRPLIDKAQALELVERLDMRLHRETQCNGTVWNAAAPIHGGPLPEYASGSSPSILRAICLCAARVQQAREVK